jgi:hypothetical protein
MDKQLAARIKRGLKGIKSIDFQVKGKIFKTLQEDLILPTLKLKKNCTIHFTVVGDEVTLVLGPRDWQWNQKTGKLIGCGTFLL